MLSPFGSPPMTTTSAPASRSAWGAATLAAPCAQSTPTLRPARRVGGVGRGGGAGTSGGAAGGRAGPAAADAGARRPQPRLAHPALDRVLDLVGELVPALGEELDAVVRHG